MNNRLIVTLAFLGAALERLDKSKDDPIIADARKWLLGELPTRAQKFWDEFDAIEEFENDRGLPSEETGPSTDLAGGKIEGPEVERGVQTPQPSKAVH